MNKFFAFFFNQLTLKGLFLFSLPLVLATISHGQTFVHEKGTLAGVKAVRVLIEKIDPEAEANGLTETQIQTDVELRLRKAGIKVVDVTNLNAPYLICKL